MVIEKILIFWFRHYLLIVTALTLLFAPIFWNRSKTSSNFLMNSTVLLFLMVIVCYGLLIHLVLQVFDTLLVLIIIFPGIAILCPQVFVSNYLRVEVLSLRKQRFLITSLFFLMIKIFIRHFVNLLAIAGFLC